MIPQLVLFAAANFGGTAMEELQNELRNLRVFTNGAIEYSMDWPTLGDLSRRTGDFRFVGEDRIFTEYDPFAFNELIVAPHPRERRAKIGPYLIQNHGDHLQSTVSTNGYNMQRPIPDLPMMGIYPDIDAHRLPGLSFNLCIVALRS